VNQILFQIVLLFSKLPLKILYVLSDFIFFILYYIAGYRKKVVFENIKNSFPEKSDEEIKKISKKFSH
jgi:KDO2-lipid IV(A) lauroyltransferase